MSVKSEHDFEVGKKQDDEIIRLRFNASEIMMTDPIINDSNDYTKEDSKSHEGKGKKGK